MKLRIHVFLAIAAALCLSDAASSLFLDSDWPNMYHDIMHSSCTNASSKVIPGEIVLLKVYEASSDISSPVTADLDDDGKAEIVFSSIDGRIYVLDSDYNEVWVHEGDCVPTAPTIAELGNDSVKSVLFGCSDKRLYSLDKEGTEEWSYRSGDAIVKPPAVINIDYTPEKEVVFVSEDRNLYILNAYGKKIKSVALLDSGLSMPSVADINGNGDLEILIGSADNKLHILDYPEPTRWFYDTHGCVSHATIANVSGTNISRITVGTCDGHVHRIYYAEYTKGSTKKCSGGNCSIEPIKYSMLSDEWDASIGEEIVDGAATADLDMDLKKEYAVGTSDNNIYLIDHDGELLERYSVDGRIASTPVIADFDGDMLPDIVFATNEGNIYVMNSSAYCTWRYESNKTIKQQPAVSDLDRDGALEMIYPVGKRLYVFGVEKEVEATTTTSTSTTTTTEETTTTTMIPSECTDSDEMDITSKGMVYGTYDGKNYSHADTCNEGVLNEYVCITPSGQSVPDVRTIYCPNSSVCVDGACVENKTSVPLKQEVFDREGLRGIVSVGLILMLLLQVALVGAVLVIPVMARRKTEKTIDEIHEFKKDLKVIEQAHNN